MTRFWPSNTVWKVLISALALLALTSIVVEVTFAHRPWLEQKQGSLRAHFTTFAVRNRPLTIDKLEADSPLAAMGAVTGDRVTIDPADEFVLGSFRAGEPVGLTLAHGDAARHVVVNTVAVPIPTNYVYGLMCDQLISAIAAIFAMLLAFKQPAAKTCRALTLFFLFQAFNASENFAPPGPLRMVSDLMSWCLVNLIVYFGALFAIYYPNDNPVGIRATLARFVPAFSALAIAVTLFSLWHIVSGHSPWANTFDRWFYGIGTIVTLTALWDGWRQTSGVDRQRCAWLLASIGTATFFTFLHIAQDVFLPISEDLYRAIFPMYETTLLLMELGIVYAVFKHRVFNFGFVVNRAIFFSASTAMLLIAFGIVEWLSEHFLHFEGREANVLLDGAIALAVYLVFHKIRHFFEHWLERVFFQTWHANERLLRKFVRQAAHITTPNALLREFQAELKRFGGGATCSIYLRDPEGNFSPAIHAEGKPVECIDVDARICVAMRTELTPVLINEEWSTHAKELALPITHRGALQGMVLLGPKPNGEEYRPDEVEVLGYAAHHIGLDLFALRIELLEGEAKADAARIEKLQYAVDHLHAAVAKVGGRTEPLGA